MSSGRKPPSLHSRLILYTSILVIALVVLVAGWLGYASGEKLKRQLGQRLTDYALTMSDKLDRGIYGRFREISLAAEMTSFESDPIRLRQVLNDMQESYPEYAWIGFADTDGVVRVSSKGLLEGANVTARPWFQEGLKRPFFGNVHKALLLEEKLPPSGDGDPYRFFDIAIPVYRPGGRQGLGVLAVHMNWKWLNELERSLFYPHLSRNDLEVMVVGDEGDVLYSSGDSFAPEKISGKVWDLIQQRPAGYLRYQPDEHKDFLVGYANTKGYRDYPGMGWAVLVRESYALAIDPVLKFQQQAVLASFLVLILFIAMAWGLSRRITRPILAIADEAEDIVEGRRDVLIDIRDDYEEVQTLSLSLQSLLKGLASSERDLRRLNAELDDKVRERTLELEETNAALSSEIQQREVVQQEKERLIQELKELANTDALTRCANRRYFFEEGHNAISRRLRQEHALTLLAADIDHFKKINDTYGHAAGDEVLRHFAEEVRTLIRETDLFARVGGEEFLILLEDTDLGGGSRLADRIRRQLAETVVTYDGQAITFTLSVGVASHHPSQSLEELVRVTDLALYEAKAYGRNCVVQARHDAGEMKFQTYDPI